MKTDSQIIDDLGGTGVVAGIFEIEPASVSEWRRNGIPGARKQALALMYPDRVPDEWRPRMPMAT
ncbi:MAG: hypothetical protein Q8L60_10805 [Gammaproteobacteria bacterium]|nr:hypothetical protein [Gammaproteobacteria bacterium]MDP2346837.1 hypothetical protein [Gammaproteobacteria bacterium]